MFSGIVEETAKVISLRKDKENLHITMTCSFVKDLNIDQSISHNGVCLTVVDVDTANNAYTITAIKETLDKSNLGLLEVGTEVNLERSMKPDAFLDGHIVQGHVDQTAKCTSVESADGSFYYTFEYDPTIGNITVEKGSVSVDGVSLTVVNSKDNSFQVAIIPFTQEITVFHTYKVGSIVNLEFDILGKYIQKILDNQLKNVDFSKYINK